MFYVLAKPPSGFHSSGVRKPALRRPCCMQLLCQNRSKWCEMLQGSLNRLDRRHPVPSHPIRSIYTPLNTHRQLPGRTCLGSSSPVCSLAIGLALGLGVALGLGIQLCTFAEEPAGSSRLCDGWLKAGNATSTSKSPAVHRMVRKVQGTCGVPFSNRPELLWRVCAPSCCFCRFSKLPLQWLLNVMNMHWKKQLCLLINNCT